MAQTARPQFRAILTWQCQKCGWANDNNNGPCRKCGDPNKDPKPSPRRKGKGTA
jgi:rubrerythrin